MNSYNLVYGHQFTPFGMTVNMNGCCGFTDLQGLESVYLGCEILDISWIVPVLVYGSRRP